MMMYVALFCVLPAALLSAAIVGLKMRADQAWEDAKATLSARGIDLP